MDDILRIEDLQINVGKFQLGPVNLNIKRGEVFAILGETGAGKTLLMELIAGYYQHYGGRIEIFSDRPLGIVFQDHALFPHLTVEDNIGYGLKCRHYNKAEIKASVGDITNLLGIHHLLKRYPNTLSGGEKQRAALARTMIIKSELLLLDEPFSALDVATREKIYEEVQTIKEKYHCTIIIITHNFNEAVRLADRIGIVLQGEMRDIVASSELFKYKQDNEINEFLRIGERDE